MAQDRLAGTGHDSLSVPSAKGSSRHGQGKARTMSTDETTADVRRELQHLLSEERELIEQAANATASGDYVRLRDVAEKLVAVAERRTLLRASLVEARARDATDQPQARTRRGSVDQAEDTWRRLR